MNQLSIRTIKKYCFIVLTLLLLVASTTVSAQKDYEKGFIITHGGDSIKGSIDLKSNTSHSKACHFLKEGESAPTTYSASDIYGYFIENGKYYVSKEVEIDDEKKTVFLEYMIDGIVDLFNIKVGGEEYYFLEKDGSLTQLSNKEKEIIDSDGDVFYKESKQYVGALIYLFQDSPKLRNGIQTTRFSDKSLIDITKDYHYSMCKEGEICIDYTKATKRSYFLEPFVGYSITKMGVKTSNDYADQNIPYGGFYIRFIPIKSNRLLNLKIGMNFTSYDFLGDFDHTLLDARRTYRAELNYSSINVPIVYEYGFPTKKLQPLIYIGFDNIFIYNPKYEVLLIYRYTNTSGEKDEFVQGEVYSKFRKYELGLMAGAGMKYNINPNSYLLFTSGYEYRIPAGRAGHFLEYKYVESLTFTLAYGFKL